MTLNRDKNVNILSKNKKGKMT